MSSPPRQAYLLLPSGDRFPLAGNTSIGRSPQGSILLDGPKVSRNHTHIYEIGGQYQVVDSQSRNGTYVNKQRIMGPVTLKTGDQIVVGGHVLVFYDEQFPLPMTATQSAERTIDEMQKMLTWLVLLDIKDSTNLTLQYGVEDYASLVRGWFSSCREIISRNDGTINQSTGDGLLAYWKDPEGICAELVSQALEGLRGLQASPPPHFRLMVHYGLVSIGGGARKGEEQLYGPEVHMIFRAEKSLSQTASDFGATESAAKALQEWMHPTELGQFSPKGFEGQYQLYKLESRFPT